MQKHKYSDIKNWFNNNNNNNYNDNNDNNPFAFQFCFIFSGLVVLVPQDNQQLPNKQQDF